MKKLSPKARTKRKVRVLFPDHIKAAILVYLQSLSIADDNDVVTEYKTVPEGIEVTLEKLND